MKRQKEWHTLSGGEKGEKIIGEFSSTKPIPTGISCPQANNTATGLLAIVPQATLQQSFPALPTVAIGQQQTSTRPSSAAAIQQILEKLLSAFLSYEELQLPQSNMSLQLSEIGTINL